MRARRWSPLLAAALVAPATAARAEPLEVVVEGSAAPGFRSVVSTDDAPREALDVASLVESAPGVHVRRLGGDESFAALSIRGAASSQVAIVLAGLPLTGAADPSLDLSSLPLWPGAPIRVHRSFAPATVGTSGWLGGVLVLDPPSLARGARTEAWAGVGSWGAAKVRVADVRRAGPVRLASALAASRSDGDYPYFDASTGAPRTRTNNGVAGVSALERVEVDIGDDAELGATLLGQAREQGLAGLARYPTRFPSLATSRLGVAADARVRTGAPDARGAGVGALRFGAFALRERSSFRDPQGEIDPSRAGVLTDDAVATQGASAAWRGVVARGLVVDAIVDARRERFTPGAGESPLGAAAASRDALGAGGDAELRVGKLALAATARADLRHDARPGDEAQDELSPTAHAGVEWRAADALVLATHAGWLARPASFVERFGNRGLLLGNPALAGERAFTVDAGLRGRARAGSLRLAWEASGFATFARGLITFLPYGRSALRAENLDAARLLGVELAASAGAGPLALRVVYTGLATRNEGSDALARGKPLPGRPAHDFAADASVEIGPARLRYGLDVVAGTTADPKGTIVLPARVLHGAGAQVELLARPAVVLGAQVDNLLDARVAEIASPATGGSVREPVGDLLGFPLPGRTFWGTVKVVQR